MKAATLALALILAISSLPAAAQDCECLCGDANCDDALNLADGMYILNYVYGGGPPPPMENPECANWDERFKLTIGDVFHNVIYVFSSPPPPSYCPPNPPPIEPEIDTTSVLYYTDAVYAQSGKATIALTLAKDVSTEVYGLSLPLRIRIDGNVPIIDSVRILRDEGCPHFDKYIVYPDSGYLAIGMTQFSCVVNDTGQIALIYVTIPPDSRERIVALEWVRLTPIQALAQDSSIIPMIYNFQAVEPILEGHCCLMPGDANMDGTVNIADAIFVIDCVFKDCLGHPCENQLDVNCDGAWNVGDGVYLINYVFKGGDPPCCL